MSTGPPTICNSVSTEPWELGTQKNRNNIQKSEKTLSKRKVELYRVSE